MCCTNKGASVTGVECGGGASGLGNGLQTLAGLWLSPQELPWAHRLPGDWRGQQSPESKRRFLRPCSHPIPQQGPCPPRPHPPHLTPLQLPYTVLSAPFDPRAPQPVGLHPFQVCLTRGGSRGGSSLSGRRPPDDYESSQPRLQGWAPASSCLPLRPLSLPSEATDQAERRSQCRRGRAWSPTSCTPAVTSPADHCLSRLRLRFCVPTSLPFRRGCLYHTPF